MWEFTLTPFVVNTIFGAHLMGITFGTLLAFVFKRTSADLPEEATGGVVLSEARKGRMALRFEVNSKISKLAIGINGSGCGATLLLVSALIGSGSDAARVVEVLVTFYVGICYGTFALLFSYFVTPIANKEFSLNLVTTIFYSSVIGLSHFLAGGLQLIFSLSAVA